MFQRRSIYLVTYAYLMSLVLFDISTLAFSRVDKECAAAIAHCNLYKNIYHRQHSWQQGTRCVQNFPQSLQESFRNAKCSYAQIVQTKVEIKQPGSHEFWIISKFSNTIITLRIIDNKYILMTIALDMSKAFDKVAQSVAA